MVTSTMAMEMAQWAAVRWDTTTTMMATGDGKDDDDDEDDNYDDVTTTTMTTMTTTDNDGWDSPTDLSLARCLAPGKD